MLPYQQHHAGWRTRKGKKLRRLKRPAHEPHLVDQALKDLLAGATADEIVDDYMITYYNYYRITKEDKPEKYEAILGNVRDFFYCICKAEDGADIRSLDLKAGAENYLRRGGLNDSQIARIEEYINK